MFKKLFIAVSAALLLSGCGSDGENTPSSVIGVGQKGPFAVGSHVSLCQLDPATALCTAATTSTRITDKKGAFAADPSWAGWTQVTVSGKSFNEYTGVETPNSLTLNAIVNLRSNDTPHVNLFTHLVAARVKELIKTKAINAAYTQAETELQSAFGLLASTQVDALDILDGRSSLAGENAILLAFSGAFHAVGGNATKLNELAADFADDAQFNQYSHFKDMLYATGEGEDTDNDGVVDLPNAFLNKLSANLSSNDPGIIPPKGSNVVGINNFQLKRDPLAKRQWHLGKIKIAGAQTCALNANTCRGEGILVGVLDDGIEIAHEDLKNNIASQQSRNFNQDDNSKDAYYDPTPRDADSAHGTMVAGLIAAADQNGKGVRGVAPRAQLAGLNILSTKTVGAFATALGNTNIMVSNNSWGPTDNTCAYQDFEGLVGQAIETAVNGAPGKLAARHGKGAIVLFASGNGGMDCDAATGVSDDLKAVIGTDQSSMDPLANNLYVIAVAALARDAANTKALYSEPGVNILISAPAGNFCSSELGTLVTTDLSGERGMNNDLATNELPAGNTNYTQCMNGTSGATPVVSGVAALILQANPKLTWRDVRAILANSATQNDSSDAGWQTNAVSHLKVHRYYGYGMVNAEAAVALAKTWVNLPKSKYVAGVPNVTLSPADNGADTASGMISVSDLPDLDILEIIRIGVEFNHQRAGDIELVLEHRDNDGMLISSEYLVKLNADNSNTARTYIFTSVQHLDDTPEGQWILKATDRYPGNTGSVTWKSIEFLGHQTPVAN